MMISQRLVDTRMMISGAISASSHASSALSVSSLAITSGQSSGACPVCAMSSFSPQNSAARETLNVTRCSVGAARLRASESSDVPPVRRRLGAWLSQVSLTRASQRRAEPTTGSKTLVCAQAALRQADPEDLYQRRVLRIEAVAHNIQELNCGRSLE